MSSQVPGKVPEEIINAMHFTMEQSAQIARYNHERLRRNQAVHAAASMVFTMPPPPTFLVSGVAIGVEIETPSKVHFLPVVPWLDAVSFFIPKSIREPFLGDLREDLEHMATGHSRASVWCAAISQVAVLALRWAWSSLVRR